MQSLSNINLPHTQSLSYTLPHTQNHSHIYTFSHTLSSLSHTEHFSHGEFLTSTLAPTLKLEPWWVSKPQRLTLVAPLLRCEYTKRAQRGTKKDIQHGTYCPGNWCLCRESKAQRQMSFHRQAAGVQMWSDNACKCSWDKRQLLAVFKSIIAQQLGAKGRPHSPTQAQCRVEGQHLGESYSKDQA